MNWLVFSEDNESVATTECLLVAIRFVCHLRDIGINAYYVEVE